MLTSLSPERRILQKLAALDLSADHLAVIDGAISPSRLSQAFRGVKTLENPTAERLFRLLDELAELQQMLAPVPILWRDVAAIRMLSEAKRADRLEVKIELGGS